jgi:hypothetical protein
MDKLRLSMCSCLRVRRQGQEILVHATLSQKQFSLPIRRVPLVACHEWLVHQWLRGSFHWQASLVSATHFYKNDLFARGLTTISSIRPWRPINITLIEFKIPNLQALCR